MSQRDQPPPAVPICRGTRIKQESIDEDDDVLVLEERCIRAEHAVKQERVSDEEVFPDEDVVVLGERNVRVQQAVVKQERFSDEEHLEDDADVVVLGELRRERGILAEHVVKQERLSDEERPEDGADVVVPEESGLLAEHAVKEERFSDEERLGDGADVVVPEGGGILAELVVKEERISDEEYLVDQRVAVEQEHNFSAEQDGHDAEDAAPSWMISGCQGNATDVWGLHTEVDLNLKREANSDGEDGVEDRGLASEMAATAIKEERKSDEEEGRELLFGGQPDLEEPEESDELEELEEGEIEPSGNADLPGDSTTLHPAVPFDEQWTRQVSRIREERKKEERRKRKEERRKWKEERRQRRKEKETQRLAERKREERRQREVDEERRLKLAEIVEQSKAEVKSPRGPAVIEAPPMPPRQAHQRGITCDRAHELHLKQQLGQSPSPPRASGAHGGLSPAKKPKLEAASPSPSPPRRRSSDAGWSSDDSAKRRRIAHQPPSWYAGTESPAQSRDPRLNRVSPEAVKPEGGKGLKREGGSPSSSTSPPPRKRGLLPTPPRECRVDYQPTAGCSKDADYQRPAPACKKRDPEYQRPAPACKKRDYQPASRASSSKKPDTYQKPSPACKKRPVVKEEEDSSRSPDPRLQKPRADLPFLPPASHINMPAHFVTRSPLFVEDDAPRKSYSSGLAESGDGKVRGGAKPSQWIDDLLYKICQWRPDWLKESERISHHKVPNIIKNIDGFATELRKLHFSSAEEYFNYFEAGLLLELWETLKHEKVLGNSNWKSKWFAVAETPVDTPLYGKRIKRTYECRCGSDNKKPPNIGDLVIVTDLKANEKKKFFAYVITAAKQCSVADSSKVWSLLEPYIEKEPTFICTFKLVIISDDFQHETSQVLQILKVRTIYDEVAMFKYLNDFSFNNLSPLSPIVLEPRYTPRAEPMFNLKTYVPLGGEQKACALSVIQDVLHYEAPSVNIITGGPGTGKSYLAAVLAQELAESKPKNIRECTIIIASKTHAQLDILNQKLRSQKEFISKEREHDAFRAVFFGSGHGQKVSENLRNITISRLAQKHVRSSQSETQPERIARLSKEITKIDRKLAPLEHRAQVKPERLKKVAFLNTLRAQKVQEVALVNAKIETRGDKAEEQDAHNLILENCDIMLTTISGNSCWEKFQQKSKRKHTVLIVDDASEAIEPAIVKLIVVFGITDVILLGDLKQHRPFVPSNFARNAGLVVSFMERYMQCLEKEKSTPWHRHLTKQYRLHPDILRGINEVFYNRTMKYVPDDRKWFFRPYVWLNCSYISDSGTEKYAEEVDFIVKLLDGIKGIYKMNPEEVTRRIQVMSFNNQISNRLSTSSISSFCAKKDLSGSECDIMIVSVGPTKKNIWNGKLLTALSRARKCLLICGKFSEELPVNLLPLLREAKARGALEDFSTEPEIDEIMTRIKP